MIDWYILLAPLVVLPIILLFAFVGCVPPPLEAVVTTFKLGYDLKKQDSHGGIANSDIVEIEVTFTAPQFPLASTKKEVTWMGDNATDTFEGSVSHGGEGGIDCTCHVDLWLSGNKKHPLPDCTALDQKSHVIQFILSFSEATGLYVWVVS